MNLTERAARLGREVGKRDTEAWAVSTCTALEAWTGRNPRPPEPNLSALPLSMTVIREMGSPDADAMIDAYESGYRAARDETIVRCQELL